MEQDQQTSTQQSSNEYTIIPYVPIDGVFTLTDELIANFYWQLVQEELIDTIFFERGMADVEDFLAFCKDPMKSMVFVARGDDPVGFSWLAPISSNFAFGHFGFFRRYWGKECQEVAPQILAHFFSFKDSLGERLIDVIIGCIPAGNTRAQGFALNIGGTKLGNIPSMFKSYEGVRDDAAVFYFVPESGDG